MLPIVMVPSNTTPEPDDHSTPPPTSSKDDPSRTGEESPDPISHLNAALGALERHDKEAVGGIASELDRIRLEMGEVMEMLDGVANEPSSDPEENAKGDSSFSCPHRTLGDVIRWGRTHLVSLARAQGTEIRLEMDTWLELLPSSGVLSVMLERIRQALNDDDYIPTLVEVTVSHTTSGQVRICVTMRGHHAMDALLQTTPSIPGESPTLPSWYRIVQSKGGTILLRDAATDTPCLEACYPANFAAPRGRQAG